MVILNSFDTLHYIMDNVFIRYGFKLFGQILGIPVGNNCAPLVADLFLLLLFL